MCGRGRERQIERDRGKKSERKGYKETEKRRTRERKI
jgi:hypothetical protein